MQDEDPSFQAAWGNYIRNLVHGYGGDIGTAMDIYYNYQYDVLNGFVVAGMSDYLIEVTVNWNIKFVVPNDRCKFDGGEVIVRAPREPLKYLYRIFSPVSGVTFVNSVSTDVGSGGYWNSLAWGQIGSAGLGLFLGVGEVLLGALGEIPSAGISTGLIVDGGVRILSNTIKMGFLFTSNTQLGIVTPSNIGGWIGKAFDLALGAPYSVISTGQGVGSFVNDFTTFAISGGSALSLSNAIMRPSVGTVYSYGLTISGTPYTAYSDAKNWFSFRK